MNKTAKKVNRVILTDDLMQETPSTIKRVLENLASSNFGRRSKVRIVAEIVKPS